MQGLQKLVLVVDDEQMLEQYIQAVLAKYGYVSQSFTDPVKALEFFEERHDLVDLIITDIKMPVIDGLELARRAKTIKPDVPIVFVSSDPQKLDQAKLIAPTRGCFLKPVSSKELAACVESLIGASPAPSP
jgi:two-component system, cell cycle sensor histidine kinase and response regulator CckA